MPQRKGLVPREHVQPLLDAQTAARDADDAFKAAVVAALLAGGSVREVAALLDMSTNTITRWGHEGGWPSQDYIREREAKQQRSREWREFMERFPKGPPPTE